MAGEKTGTVAGFTLAAGFRSGDVGMPVVLIGGFGFSEVEEENSGGGGDTAGLEFAGDADAGEDLDEEDPPLAIDFREDADAGLLEVSRTREAAGVELSLLHGSKKRVGDACWSGEAQR